VLEVDLLRDGQTCQQHQSPGTSSDFGFCAGATIIALSAAAAEHDVVLAISSGWRR
jgi:hypothetical protein